MCCVRVDSSARRSRVTAMRWAGICEEQQLDRNGSLRALLWIADAVDVLPGQRGHVLVELAELFRRHVQQELTGAGCLLPLSGDVATELETFLEAVEVEVVEDPAERVRRQTGLGVVADVGVAHAGVHQPPRALASGDTCNLLDEAVFGELAEVEGARGRALADKLAGLRGRERTLGTEHLEDRDAHRVGDSAHRPWVGELAWLGIRERRDLDAVFLGVGEIRIDIHVSNYISRKISLQV